MAKSPTEPAPPLAAVAAMLVLLYATPAQALSKVWVAALGTDGAACGAVTSPCRTFQGAHDNAVNGGEIGVLTPGAYGRFVITKSVAVTNDGSGEASVLVAPDEVGIAIGNVGVGDVVSLRGLIVDGQILGGTGILAGSGSALHVQNCVIRNFEGASSGVGLAFGPESRTMQLFVSDTIVYNNGSRGFSAGILIEPSFGGSANVVLDRVQLENNVNGLFVDSTLAATPGTGAHVVIRNSVVSGNAGDGILARTIGLPAFIVVEHTAVVNNAGIGIHADGPHATILLNDDTITRNGTGIGAVNGGQLISYGNNKNNNNIGPEGAPTGFYSPM